MNACFFDENISEILHLCFRFIQQTDELSGVVGCRKLPNLSLSNLFNLLSIGLRIGLWMAWFWPVVPRYSYAKRSITKLQASIWNFPSLKQAVSVIHFSDMLIINELLLRKWKERQFKTGHLRFVPVNVSSGTEI